MPLNQETLTAVHEIREAAINDLNTFVTGFKEQPEENQKLGASVVLYDIKLGMAEKSLDLLLQLYQQQNYDEVIYDAAKALYEAIVRAMHTHPTNDSLVYLGLNQRLKTNYIMQLAAGKKAKTNATASDASAAAAAATEDTAALNQEDAALEAAWIALHAITNTYKTTPDNTEILLQAKVLYQQLAACIETHSTKNTDAYRRLKKLIAEIAEDTPEIAVAAEMPSAAVFLENSDAVTDPVDDKDYNNRLLTAEQELISILTACEDAGNDEDLYQAASATYIELLRSLDQHPNKISDVYLAIQKRLSSILKRLTKIKESISSNAAATSASASATPSSQRRPWEYKDFAVFFNNEGAESYAFFHPEIISPDIKPPTFSMQCDGIKEFMKTIEPNFDEINDPNSQLPKNLCFAMIELRLRFIGHQIERLLREKDTIKPAKKTRKKQGIYSETDLATMAGTLEGYNKAIAEYRERLQKLDGFAKCDIDEIILAFRDEFNAEKGSNTNLTVPLKGVAPKSPARVVHVGGRTGSDPRADAARVRLLANATRKKKNGTNGKKSPAESPKNQAANETAEQAQQALLKETEISETKDAINNLISRYASLLRKHITETCERSIKQLQTINKHHLDFCDRLLSHQADLKTLVGEKYKATFYSFKINAVLGYLAYMTEVNDELISGFAEDNDIALSISLIIESGSIFSHLLNHTNEKAFIKNAEAHSLLQKLLYQYYEIFNYDFSTHPAVQSKACNLTELALEQNLYSRALCIQNIFAPVQYKEDTPMPTPEVVFTLG